MEKVYIFLAEGFEEIEAITIIDMLRRADIPTTTISIQEELFVKGAHGINVEADKLFSDVDYTDALALVLPGGMPGTTNLLAHEGLRHVLVAQHEANKYVCAICAAPTVLGNAGILDGKKATCYPSFEEGLGSAFYEDAPVVSQDNIVTSKGPGTAITFALELIKKFGSEEKAEEVAKGMLLR